MTTSSPARRTAIAQSKAFISVCLTFTLTVVLFVFFEEDLLRLLTPFLEPPLIVALLLMYAFLFIASVVWVLVQWKKRLWHALIPMAVNSALPLVVYFLYLPLTHLNNDIKFWTNETRYEEAAQWVTQSVESGQQAFTEKPILVVELPPQFPGIADRNQALVSRENGIITVFFSRGGGMFEFYPSFMYRSDSPPPPVNDGDINCVRQLKPGWYDCY